MMSWDESRDQHICKVVSPIVKRTEVKVAIMRLMNRLGGGRKRKTQEIPVSGLVPGVYTERARLGQKGTGLEGCLDWEFH